MKSTSYSNNYCSTILMAGVLRKTFSDVAKNIAMVSEKELSEISGISQRTISRMAPDQKLPPYTAEIIISILRTYNKAIEVFESEELAHKWLKTPLVALSGKTPLEAVSNRFGAEFVLDILGRIETGVYS